MCDEDKIEDYFNRKVYDPNEDYKQKRKIITSKKDLEEYIDSIMQEEIEDSEE